MDMRRYTYRTELHAHTSPASMCGKIPAPELVKTYSSLGYDSVVITNHFAHYYIKNKNDKGERNAYIQAYLNDFYQAREEGKKCGITVILGAELCFSENANDYLFYGIDEGFFERAFDYLWKGIAAFSRDMRNDKNVLIQAHPFRDNMVTADASYLDGTEVYNLHTGHNSRIGQAAKYAAEHNFIITAGSDTHETGNEGMCALRTAVKPETSFDIAKILRSRDYYYEIGGGVILPYGLSGGMGE